MITTVTTINVVIFLKFVFCKNISIQQIKSVDKQIIPIEDFIYKPTKANKTNRL